MTEPQDSIESTPAAPAREAAATPAAPPASVPAAPDLPATSDPEASDDDLGAYGGDGVGGGVG